MLSYGFLWDCMLVVPRHKAKQNTHIHFFLVVLFGFKFTKTRAAIDQFEDLVHIHFIKDNVLPFKF